MLCDYFVPVTKLYSDPDSNPTDMQTISDPPEPDTGPQP